MIDECYYVKSSEDIYSYKVKWNKVVHTAESFHTGREYEVIDRPEINMEFKFDAKSAVITLPIWNNSNCIYCNEVYEDVILEVLSKYDTLLSIDLIGDPLPNHIPNILANDTNIRSVNVVINDNKLITPDGILSIMELAGSSINSKNPITLEIRCEYESKDILNSVSELWKYITNSEVVITGGGSDEGNS